MRQKSNSFGDGCQNVSTKHASLKACAPGCLATAPCNPSSAFNRLAFLPKEAQGKNGFSNICSLFVVPDVMTAMSRELSSWAYCFIQTKILGAWSY
eukprot:1160912-Pelagomonas_calceolata.AAC.3